MNKQEYLDALRRALAQMPGEEKEKQLAYYDELIQDMCEDGMSETEATARLGEPDAVAQELLAALPLWALVKTRVRPSDGFSPLVIARLSAVVSAACLRLCRGTEPAHHALGAFYQLRRGGVCPWPVRGRDASGACFRLC